MQMDPLKKYPDADSRIGYSNSQLVIVHIV